MKLLLILVFSVLFANDIDDLTKFRPVNSEELNQKSQSIDELNQYKPTSSKELNSQKSNNTINLEELTKLAPSDEENLNIDDSQLYQDIQKKDIALSITSMPSSVFPNQVFSIKLNADIGQNIDVDMNLTMKKNEDMLWLNERNIKWETIKPGVFSTEIWLEANSTKAKFQTINLILNRNGDIFQKASMNLESPNVKKLPKGGENFSHIVASNLNIRSFKSSKFNDQSNIMTIELTTENGNLNSFYIDNKDIIKQGVDSIKGVANKQNGYYFVVLSKDVKNFNFDYYNLLTQKFESFSLPVIVEVETLSTQSELNPKENSFDFYRNIVILCLICLLLIMFITSKNTTPLIFAIILGVIFIFLQNSYKSAIVKQEAKVRILPIDRSTIFFISGKEEEVEILAQTDNFYKILFDNSKIGWVDKKDIIEK